MLYHSNKIWTLLYTKLNSFKKSVGRSRKLCLKQTQNAARGGFYEHTLVNFLIRWATITFTRTILLYEINENIIKSNIK